MATVTKLTKDAKGIQHAQEQEEQECARHTISVEVSSEPDVFVELRGFGITNFDPADVQKNDKHCSTVGGDTVIYLTVPEVEALIFKLTKLVG